MNKSKYLALITAVSIMSVGVGYAAWSQSLTVTHEVSMGHLKVNVEDFGDGTRIKTVRVDNQSYSIPGESTKSHAIHFDKGKLGSNYNAPFPYFSFDLSLPENEEGLVVKLNDVYPGIVFTGNVALKNVGTIPIKFEDVNVKAVGLDEASSQALAAGEIVITKSIGPNSTLNENHDGKTSFEFEINIKDNLSQAFMRKNLNFKLEFKVLQNTN